MWVPLGSLTEILLEVALRHQKSNHVCMDRIIVHPFDVHKGVASIESTGAIASVKLKLNKILIMDKHNH